MKATYKLDTLITARLKDSLKDSHRWIQFQGVPEDLSKAQIADRHSAKVS